MLYPRDKQTRNIGRWRPYLERLEARELMASDFGDAPLPYKTLLAEGGAEHVAVGPTLGATRDTEADGAHSTAANGDDNTGIDDEDGVIFGTIRAGQLAATAIANVRGGAARLDAWIDFNRDGSWGGPGEQIADRVAVVPGNNSISFDVPSWATDGTTYARFRVSTTGNLGMGGIAADGEVEDYAVTVAPPKTACGCFSTHIISTTADGATSVYAADVDGDGDTDVVSAAGTNDKIAWYENDGSQNFTSHTISTAANSAQSVFAVDVDGDGDTDVLSASYNNGKIAWYENDGSQNFTAHIISTGASLALSVFAADMDGDGDTDVLSAAGFNHKIAWYENDGSQNFTAHTITTAAIAPSSVFAADVDGDGDTDVLSASQLDDKIAWYENDGSQNFTAHAISTAADSARSVFAADVDDDGDIDVLSASPLDYKIAWYENDGSQNFTAHTISTAAQNAQSVFAADVDGDGDTDVLSASPVDDKIAWYENDGSQNFTAHTISTAANAAWSVHAADVDNDGDLDVLSASIIDDKIAWYENRLNVSGGLQTDPVTPTILPLPIPPAETRPGDGRGDGGWTMSVDILGALIQMPSNQTPPNLPASRDVAVVRLTAESESDSERTEVASVERLAPRAIRTTTTSPALSGLLSLYTMFADEIS